MVYSTNREINRITLIPKPSNVDDATNWRPITIESIGYTLLINDRLEIKNYIRQHKRQKDFTTEDGCKNNIAILNSALANMKEKGNITDSNRHFQSI